MNNQAAIKLRLWSQFDKDIGNLLPYLVLGASILTVIAPILGLVGVLKKSQIIITTVCLTLYCSTDNYTYSAV